VRFREAGSQDPRRSRARLAYAPKWPKSERGHFDHVLMGAGVVVSDLLTAAIDYARRGWPCFPVEPGGKRPLGRLVPHGLLDATIDTEIITAWWGAEPNANIGLVTGLAFDVLDIDGPECLDALELAGPIVGPNIEGPTVATPRGWHCYVKPTGRGNGVNIGGIAGIDWRGAGGYVVAPPSRKADGGTWDWMVGTPQDLGPDTPIIPAPAWVLALFDRRQARSPDLSTERLPRHAGKTGYGAAAMERELGHLAVAVEGTRNHQLNASAHSLGQLVAGGYLQPREVIVGLLNVGRQIGLSDSECEKTIDSGLSAGLRSPRRVA
jgi:hypothetical protein